MTGLSVDDFAACFQEVHGCAPFPWQDRLMRFVAETNRWPTAVDLPTGAGKTAAIDVAVFHLALDADRTRTDRSARRAPLRVAFVVDRRLVVDAAFERAKHIAATLHQPVGPITARVAEVLRGLAGDAAPPLAAVRLRGGIPRDDGWVRSPVQPTVLTATVDQIGSRLLFRGYGVSDRAKPIHAGLLGIDTLVLLDEAHLAEPFRQTMDWVTRYAGPDWRSETGDRFVPFGYAPLSATPGAPQATAGHRIDLTDEDRAHPVLARRLSADKPVRLVGPPKGRKEVDAEDEEGEEGEEAAGPETAEEATHVAELVSEATRLLSALAEPASHRPRGFPAVAVIVNRVARARQLHRRLADELSDAADVELLIGPARHVERDLLTAEPADDSAGEEPDAWRRGLLTRIGTGQRYALRRPLVLVATQTIEAGVDIDLDGIVSDLAPLDALQQRFGRLDRDGTARRAEGVIVAEKRLLSSRGDDPVYGKAPKAAWEHLLASAETRDRVTTLSFGIDAVRAVAANAPAEALSERPDAPILMPAHVDLLAQTAPVPFADPEVALFLRGPQREPASVTVVWRADIAPDLGDDITRRLLLLVRPRGGEAIELPFGAVRRWLLSSRGDRDLADVAGRLTPDYGGPARGEGRRVFRFRGDDDRSLWIDPHEIRPGDTIVVPAGDGGVDRFGFDPESGEPATDVADAAAEPYADRVVAVRVAAGLLMPPDVPPARETPAARRRRREERADRASAIGAALSTLVAELPVGRAPARAEALAAALRADPFDEAHADAVATLAERIGAIAEATRLELVLDAYGVDDQGRPRGAIVIARGHATRADRSKPVDAGIEMIDDDLAGSIAGEPVTLPAHTSHVVAEAERYAERLGLPPAMAADVALAARLHDAGKADPRFQAWLAGGDPLGAAPGRPLAKSGRRLPRDARRRADLPDSWRHEALSVRIAEHHPAFAAANDPDLVLWLIGTHHGHGRPFFPFADQAAEATFDLGDGLVAVPATPGPQALVYDRGGRDWASLMVDLERRYGVWRLAHLEAVLRLADQAASAEEAGEGSDR